MTEVVCKPARGPVDMHVHFVGNGRPGSRCRLDLLPWQYPLAGLMLRQAGIPARSLRGDLDQIYTELLLGFLRQSSLSAAVVLAQDHVYTETGQRVEKRGGFYVPNDPVLRLARDHPEILPGISIHPARPDALQELDQCIASGAVLLKCLPNCQNIDCRLPKYKPFWERMAAAGLPLLAHTGGEHTLPVIRRELADPRILIPPLECGVTVIAAHSGTCSGPGERDFFPEFAKMCANYPNFYGDTSAFNVPFRNRHVRECLKPPLSGRLVHGSDFPVPVSGVWAWMRGLLSWKALRACGRIQNPLERDYQLKRAMGFGPEHFMRIWDLIPSRQGAGASR